jgi:hypothetical protein
LERVAMRRVWRLAMLVEELLAVSLGYVPESYSSILISHCVGVFISVWNCGWHVDWYLGLSSSEAFSSEYHTISFHW